MSSSHGLGVLRLNRKGSIMQAINVYLGTKDTGTKTLKEILLSINDSKTQGRSPNSHKEKQLKSCSIYCKSS